MRIWGNISQILGIDNKNKTAPKVETTSNVSAKKDVVSISNQGKDFQTALKAVKETADIRADKVGEIKKKVQTDTYEPSGEKIADKVIDSIINKKI